MTANMIIKNGNVFSPVSGDCIAVKDGKIAAVGKESELAGLIDGDTEVIDAKGNTVVPTFVDAHMHPSMCTVFRTGLKMYHIMRQDGESRETYIGRMKEAVAEYVARNPEKEIIVGYGWYPSAFTADEEGCPTRHDLDDVCAEKPIVLRSFDGHAMLVNSRALELAGIDRDTPDPKGGMFGRAADGSPDGNIHEATAMEAIFENVEGSDFSVEDYEEGIMDFQEERALPNGITAVFDAMARPNAIEAYNNLAKKGKLKINVSAAWVADPSKPESQFDEMIRNKGKYDVGETFYMKTVKFFIDGGAFGFLTNEPFEAEFLKMNGMPEDYCGESLWTEDELKRIFLKLSEAGYQIHVHCMGDGAVTLTLDAFQYVREKGVKGNRDVITHIMNITDEDVERMARLGVIAAMQPSWPIVDSILMYGVIPMFGKRRSYEQYPLGRLHDAGIMVTCSTDFPVVENVDPFIGIQNSMTRSMPKSNPEYEQYKGIVSGLEDDLTRDCMNLDDLLESYTASGAYQLFLENTMGTIEPGKSADLLVLDRNLDNTDIMDVEFTKIDTIILKGEVLRHDQ